MMPICLQQRGHCPHSTISTSTNIRAYDVHVLALFPKVVADRVDIADFMSINDMKTVIWTAKSIMDDYGLRKLDQIIEYIEKPINAGYRDGVLAIGGEYTRIQGAMDARANNYSVAQSYDNFFEGVITHEMGHYVHERYPQINDIVTTEYWQQNRSNVSIRSKDTPQEFVAESFTAYRKFGPQAFNDKGQSCPFELSKMFDKLKGQ